MNYKIVPLRENFYAIEQGHVRCFLLIGKEYALLIDTCLGGELLSVIRTLTDLPIKLVTTHADRDHTGSDGEFSERYIHPAELSTYEKGRKTEAKPVWEGDTFELGDDTLQVLHIPGHTPGSIGLLDEKNQFLISGDMVQDRTIFMHGDARNLRAFAYSMQKLIALRDAGKFTDVYAAHGSVCISAALLNDQLQLAEDILSGKAAPTEEAVPDRFPDTVKIFRHGGISMYIDTAAL